MLPLFLLLSLSVLSSLPGPAAGYAALSLASLRLLSEPTTAFDLVSGSHLAPLLQPRVPGTAGWRAAQHHLAGFFESRLPAWTVRWHNASATTPTSGGAEIPFANLVLRRDPPGSRAGDVERLTLAAHYDSLPTLDGFVGAVDSAAPCAVLLRVAEVLEPGLQRMWARAEHDDGLDTPQGLQIVFFDGEEAWDSWTDDDSLYGSRALAERWADARQHDDDEFSSPRPAFASQIDSISLLVLLDLLGAPGPTVPSFYAATHWAYQDMARVEALLRSHSLLRSSSSADATAAPALPFLIDADTPTQLVGLGNHGSVADDHVPFMQRGVDVVHLVPAPFPWDVWHRLEDDGEHLDLAVVEDWARIVAGWVGGWMEMEDALVALRGRTQVDNAEPGRPSAGGRDEL